MNIKKIVILIIIFLLCILSIFVVIAITNYFYIKKQELIQFADLKECEREWLQTQRPLQRHDIYVMSEDEIPEYMKNFNIKIDIRRYGPGYNAYNANWIWWQLKEPESGLLQVFFKSRPNPFKATYPCDHNKYTLNDLLKYELAISDAYVFWNAAKKEDLNITINHYIVAIYRDQNNPVYKENLIQKDLFDNKITNNKIHVDLNCYNANSKIGIFTPFDSNNSFHDGYKIEAVYFDGGFRIENPNVNIDNLKRLGNGAKNIYLYSFNVIDKDKKYIKPEPCDVPYTAIRDWKKTNGLFNNPQVIAKSDYIWEIKGDEFILTHTVETEDKIYEITFASNYNEKLQKWKNQCYIEPRRPYSSGEIRDKFGRTSKIIYNELGEPVNYRYVEGFWYDDWYVDDIECFISNAFYHYYNTTKPPEKPIKNDNTTTLTREEIRFQKMIRGITEANNSINNIFNNEKNQSNEQIHIIKQPEINDEKIVRPISENFKVKKINKKVKIYK